MTKPNRYVVQEALIIKKGTFTFKDNEGIAINLKKDVPIGKLIKIGGEGNFKTTDDGKLEVDKPMVFAVRNVAKVGRHWVLQKNGGKGPKYANDALRKFFLSENVEMKVNKVSK